MENSFLQRNQKLFFISEALNLTIDHIIITIPVVYTFILVNIERIKVFSVLSFSSSRGRCEAVRLRLQEGRGR